MSEKKTHCFKIKQGV